MISKETYDKLQEYKEIGLSILKSSEKLWLSYKTAYNWWNKTDEEFTSFQKQHEFMLDNYRQYLIEQIKMCPQINNSLLLKRLISDFSDFWLVSIFSLSLWVALTLAKLHLPWQVTIFLFTSYLPLICKSNLYQLFL